MQNLTSFIVVAVLSCLLASCKTGGRDERKNAAPPAPSDDAQAIGGVNDGNTGELMTTRNNPWFVGNAPATYCVQYGDSAPSDADARALIDAQVAKAFESWISILDVLSPVSPGSTRVPNGKFLAGEAVANLTRKFAKVPCDDKTEMRVKIGTWEQGDAAFLKYTSKHTVAYALRTAYTEETGRSRGFIWLVPDAGEHRYKGPAPDGAFWTQGSYVYNVLLHEIGHVFGIDHLPASFMDAAFPAGVLAAKMSDAWSPDDMKQLGGLDREQCGSLHKLDGDADLLVLKDVFGVEPAGVTSVCWRAAEDHRRPEDDGTPTLFWLKGPADTRLAEQLFTVDGVYGNPVRVSGNYLKEVGAGEYRYAAITHAYYSPEDLYRMRFRRNERQYWVESEVAAPGFVAFRFAYEGAWKTLGVLLMPLERHKSLLKVLDAASFDDDDEVIDD